MKPAFYAEAGTLKWDGQSEPSGAGWYFWAEGCYALEHHVGPCSAGCLADSDPIGPYPSEEAAAAAAMEWDE